MNYRGSFCKLLGNANAALIAAIEIYNKPAFDYRDECVVILVLNAWELILKALLSKNGESIFYKKKRNYPYRTLSCQDALVKAREFFPKGFDSLPVQRNIELLSTYRDNAVHFYNADGFGIIIYALAQTCIMNFRDLMVLSFDQRFEDKINWQLLPLGINPPIDVISFISGKYGDAKKPTNAVRHFLSVLAESTAEIKTAGFDTGRLLTVFTVKLQSVKKIGDADIVVGVDKAADVAGPLAIVKIQDPNISHPLRQKDVVGKISDLNANGFSPYTFQAINWKYRLKENSQYCWRAKEGCLVKYSNDIITFIIRLTEGDIENALREYREHLRARAKRK
jgi:hypothetical protein